MSNLSEELRKRIFRLLLNTSKLVIILFFLRISVDILKPYIRFGIIGYLITGEMVLNFLSLLFIIYYGYGILADVRFLLDIASKALVVKFGTTEHGEKSGTKHVLYDIIYLIILILGAAAIIPIVSSLPSVGSLLTRIVTLTMVAVGLLLVYHFLRSIYLIMRIRVDKTILKISKELEKTGPSETKDKQERLVTTQKKESNG